MKTDTSRFIATAALLCGALIAAAKCAGLYLDVIAQPEAARAFHDASMGLLVSGGLVVFGLGVMALCLRLGRAPHLRVGAGAGPAARPVQTNGSVPGAEVSRVLPFVCRDVLDDTPASTEGR